MKIVFWVIGIIAALVLALGVLQYSASERVEVIQLHTRDDAGDRITTRLWVVDHKGAPYLRGEASSGWTQRLQLNKQFKMTRKGKTATYRYELRPDEVTEINQLFRDKYTWGDQVITTMLGGSREQSLAIRLIRVESP